MRNVTTAVFSTIIAGLLIIPATPSRAVEPAEFPNELLHSVKEGEDTGMLTIRHRNKNRSYTVRKVWKEFLDESSLRPEFYPLEDEEYWTWENKIVYIMEDMPEFETWDLTRTYTLRPGTKTVQTPTLRTVWNIHQALESGHGGGKQKFKKGKLLRQEETKH